MNASRLGVGFWRGYVIGVVTLVSVGLLWLGAPQPPAAYGQIPDSGAQRNQMIREIMNTNKKLAEIADLLREIRDQGKAAAADKQRRGRSDTRP
jgi:hypothetical protein